MRLQNSITYKQRKKKDLLDVLNLLRPETKDFYHQLKVDKYLKTIDPDLEDSALLDETLEDLQSEDANLTQETGRNKKRRNAESDASLKKDANLKKNVILNKDSNLKQNNNEEITQNKQLINLTTKPELRSSKRAKKTHSNGMYVYY